MIIREPNKATVNILGKDHSGPSGGHLACQGCGGALSLRMALKAIGNRCIFVIPACCMAVIDGPFPVSSLGVPLMHIAFGATAPTATGIKAGLTTQGDNETLVVAWAGDGATFDIGLGAVSAAADRNDDYLYVCYDNEAYMNTGIQQSGATPKAAWTTTTPNKKPKTSIKKDIISIMAAHRIPYIATASPSHPDDFLRKFQKAKEIKGFRFLHVFAPCPPGQRFEEKNTVKVARNAVESRVFPLLEIENGEKLTLTDIPDPIPIKEYLELQNRFAHFKNEDIEAFEKNIEKRWQELSEWNRKQT
ncbi:MAG: thiamine pyrophosphate-dependent enzyme [Candidatus Electryonea clarkiae]|nr:thiamine pyrophosphate-dependent enzyme [Candidatus Electryonea clarkiae]MDP8287597.1 thiamine pyrophosphate-dependent enzyme [Candidatus Electryonea clarkiae]